MLFLLGAVVLTACGGDGNDSPAPASVAETPDNTLFISAYIMPVTFPQSPLVSTSSTTYGVRVYLNDTDGTTLGEKVTDATVTVNGQSIPYTSFLGQYYSVLNGSYGAGSNLSVTITHPRIGTLTRELAVPSADVPGSFTIEPSFSIGSSVAPPYTITPGSPWADFGCIAALLFASGQNYLSYVSWMSLEGTHSVTFTSENLTSGSGGKDLYVPYIQFVAWSMDKMDLDSYGKVGSSPSRIRVFAPNGSLIGSNF